MFKLDRKLVTIGTVLALSSTLTLTASAADESVYKSKPGAIDGGVTYPRENGNYTAYRYNEQSTKGVNFGRPATANEIKAWDIDALPDGTGLPEGEGSVELGDELYEAQCAVCHGEFGAGGSGYPQLAGGNMDKDENGVIITLKNQRVYGSTDAPKRTVGTYWPVATTLFTYIRDAMPYAHPKSLSNDETYAITAYILAQNEIEIDGEEMDDEYVLNKEKLAKVVLPNRNGFYPNIDGPDAQENIRAFFADRAKNIGAGTRCMADCKDPGGKDGKTPPGVVEIKYEMSDVRPPYAYAKDLPPEKKDEAAHPGKKAYEANCAVCHKTDAMGAPAVGDIQAWATTLKHGIENVYKNTINGKNGMPPKGGTSLSDARIKEIVDYMVSASK
ncbi:MAG: membrane c-type cytochrome cy [uncultured Sulfurovum sp.]|uniref:Membrane c-type cytochrome cy n=1 Tax=uncultured Sulfurovum sp. TaxID=269237 RepID=A0A6S6TVH0_9BACT|nr:MAG: membrane c-type cytochrome cy [uncultured Sulfurovum sp.]